MRNAQCMRYGRMNLRGELNEIMFLLLVGLGTGEVSMFFLVGWEGF